MVIHRDTGEISHHLISDLPSLIPQEYDIVANNSRVFPARLHGQKETGGHVELLLLKKRAGDTYDCIASPGLALGQKLTFPIPAPMGSLLHRNARMPLEQGSATVDRRDPQGTCLSATVTGRDDRVRTVTFDIGDPELTEILAKIGTMPTPPYIKKMLANADDYQTVYAKYDLPAQSGFSAAAPTAGLHFTLPLLDKLKARHTWHEVTLNVGLGTFLPVQVADITKHHMHTEDYTITNETAQAVNTSRTNGRRLLAIGTTTVRTLESNCMLQGSEPALPAGRPCKLTPGNFSTDIFIYPPYLFQMTDALLTNFHLPESTLLMLVSAFASAPNTGTPFTNFADSLIGRAYRLAVEEKYRFFSFGDAMLIL
jgi:S-adenosylmethionine:tRNA ribosyltransferase-isomerase